MTNNKLKKELINFVLWLCLYLTLLLFANILSNLVIKIPNSINAVFEIIFSAVMIVFLKNKKLLSYYGINSLKRLDFRNCLYFIPMIIFSLSNLIFGIHINDPWQQILLISVAMLGVGFIEELLFRGFLMKALMNKNEKAAILLSGSFFGILHLINLFGGADTISTILQVIYAASFGLMCSMFFYKTNNIIPCMICHILTNITDTFLPSDLSLEYQYIGCIAMIIPSVFYTWYLYKTKKPLTKDMTNSDLL